MEFFIENYISQLMKQQNDTHYDHLKNIYTKKEYLVLIKEVLDIILNNPNMSFDEYKNMLLKNSNIAYLLSFFVDERKLSPGLSIAFGTKKHQDYLYYGNMQEVLFQDNEFVWTPKEMQMDTIFDLASTSKLFTTISILKLRELNLLSLHDPITKYAPEFVGLSNCTIYDLLTFSKEVHTKSRIDDAKNPKDAYNVLKTIFTCPSCEFHNFYPYTDMGAMILKIIIEKITNMPFKCFLEEIIFKPLHMNNTFVNVPDDLLYKVASENYNSIVNNEGKIVTNIDIYPGIPHDIKTQKMGHEIGVAPGHAGIFSNANDMSKLALSLITGSIISKPNVLLIGDSFNGKKVIFENQEVYNCHVGFLCFTKQLNADFRSVPYFLSGKSFLQPGYSGISFCVDAQNEIYAFIGGNRLHNRIRFINENFLNNVQVQDNSPIYIDETGKSQIISSTFSKEIQILNAELLKLALQYKFLEDLLDLEKEKKKSLIKKTP